MEQTYFRRGFGLKGAIEGALAADYHSRLVDLIRERGYALVAGDLTFRLAGEFGFCYGVDRAVEYAYETRSKFPEQRIFLSAKSFTIALNAKLGRNGREIGLHRPENAEFDSSVVTPRDVVILLRSGHRADLERLRAIVCVLVDHTCGPWLNVGNGWIVRARRLYRPHHGSITTMKRRRRRARLTSTRPARLSRLPRYAKARAVCGTWKVGGIRRSCSNGFSRASFRPVSITTGSRARRGRESDTMFVRRIARHRG